MMLYPSKVGVWRNSKKLFLVSISVLNITFLSGCKATELPSIQGVTRASTAVASPSLARVVPAPGLSPTSTRPIPPLGSNPTQALTLSEPTQASTPHVSPYIDVIVDNVEIRYLKTNPVQVELVIRGTLPDQCKYGFYSVENRRNLNVKITLFGIHPADNSCKQTNQIIEYMLLLGRDMPEIERGFAPGNYELNVNNYKTTFSIR